MKEILNYGQHTYFTDGTEVKLSFRQGLSCVVDCSTNKILCHDIYERCHEFIWEHQLPYEP